MKPFEIIEHTADIGIRARGVTLMELFENSARGMFSLITKEAVKPQPEIRKEIHIDKSSDKFEEILVAWLSELLYIFNKEKVFFNSFKISNLNNKGLKADVSGFNAGPRQESLRKEIKAVTFHNLRIEEAVDGFSCVIIFDV